MLRALILTAVFYHVCSSTSGIKYPWLTNMYSNRLRAPSGFSPDSYNAVKFNSIAFDDPSSQVNAAFEGDSDISRPTVNYRLAMRKYWALLNPYEAVKDKPIKKWVQFAEGEADPDDSTIGDGDDGQQQYAQLGSPEYTPDLPVFPADSLKTSAPARDAQT